MGCPSIYYEGLLQDFARCLAYEEDNFDLVKELRSETSVKKLEDYILEKKNQIDEKLFFYNAGLAVQRVLDDAMNQGDDSFNASIGGAIDFGYFIGLSNDDESKV